jgi:hypothetical protein
MIAAAPRVARTITPTGAPLRSALPPLPAFTAVGVELLGEVLLDELLLEEEPLLLDDLLLDDELLLLDVEPEELDALANLTTALAEACRPASPAEM